MKSNTTTAAKNITRMLSALKKHDCRTAMHFAWTDDQGRQCICDGFRAYRLTKHLPLEDRPADAGEPINLAMLFDPIDLTRYTAIDLPNAAELKAFIIAERNAKGRSYAPVWDFGPTLPAVNASYLQDLMTILPDAVEIFCQTGAAGTVRPLYAKGERGEAILLPIRIAAKYNSKAAKADAARQTAAEERRAADEEAAKRAEMEALEASAKAAADAGWAFEADFITIGGKTFNAGYSFSPSGDVYAFPAPVDGLPAVRYQIAKGTPMYAAALAAANGRPFKAAKPVEEPAPAEEAPATEPTPTAKPWIGSSIDGSGWKIAFDADAERTRVIFDAEPSAAQRAAVTEAGFYWSAQLGSFNKKLTCKAYRAAQALAVTLANIA